MRRNSDGLLTIGHRDLGLVLKPCISMQVAHKSGVVFSHVKISLITALKWGKLQTCEKCPLSIANGKKNIVDSAGLITNRFKSRGYTRSEKGWDKQNHHNRKRDFLHNLGFSQWVHLTSISMRRPNGISTNDEIFNRVSWYLTIYLLSSKKCAW